MPLRMQGYFMRPERPRIALQPRASANEPHASNDTAYSQIEHVKLSKRTGFG